MKSAKTRQLGYSRSSLSAQRQRDKLQPSRVHEYFENSVDLSPDRIALTCESESLSYAELEARANKLAHYLRRLGVRPGDRVGLLLDRSINLYVGLLAIFKSGGAFVPLDPALPQDRLAFIIDDADLGYVITKQADVTNSSSWNTQWVKLETVQEAISAESSARPNRLGDADDISYIIYTSGTTGRPKGVPINHQNICNFMESCLPIYDVRADDNVYQGMTLTFDFSIEEVWPTFAAGARLVAGPSDHRKLGSELGEFLIEHNITVMACVPTLLATIDRDVPSLRTLLVGGEACPAELVNRWYKPGRRMLNTYGPTETTVTATWTELMPGEPITIGIPLPSYSVHIFDDHVCQLSDGEIGEICIGGPSVAVGYLNRPELTDDRFVNDPFSDRPGARLYRTGDRGRCLPNGEIEYLGRGDTQVKIRGYRIELGEIESVLREDFAVSDALVAARSSEGGVTELAAYITLHEQGEGEPETLRQRLAEVVQKRLPSYMQPSYLEILESLPMLPSGKADRSKLPAPVGPRFVMPILGEYQAPQNGVESQIATVWSRVFGIDRVSVTADFFNELGGHSLFAANVISKLRETQNFSSLSIADLYIHPTIRELANHLATTSASSFEQVTKSSRRQYSTRRVWSAGVAQVGLLYLVFMLTSWPAILLVKSSVSSTLVAILISALATMLNAILLPIIFRGIGLGRLKPGKYPLWGPTFCRFWIYRKVLALAPLDYLAGSPLMSLYARWLGAKIGNNTHIGTSRIQWPGLIEIGDETSIGYGVDLEPFIVEDGWLIIKPIKIGSRVFIGTNAVIAPGAVIEDDAVVLEQSLVSFCQRIPASETWAGSPSRRVDDDVSLKEMSARSISGRLTWTLMLSYLAGFVMLDGLTLASLAPGLVLLYELAAIDLRLAILAAPFAGLLFVLTVCTIVIVGKRIAVPELGVGYYPAYSSIGLRKWISDKFMHLSLTLTNSLYATIYTTRWLRLLGAKVGDRAEISTVSNIDPDLLTVGTESFVADLAVLGAARYHRGQVSFGLTEIGSRTFIGNTALVPGSKKVPDGCLIGVQSVPPVTAMGEGTSWLGSPALFLPRRQASQKFDDSVTFRPSRKMILARALIEFFRVVMPSALTYLGILLAMQLLGTLASVSTGRLLITLPILMFALALVVTSLVIAMKWLVVGRYRARVEPMWSFFVWRTEFVTALYENVAVPYLLRWLTGTPLLALIMRSFGASIGNRAYIDTTFMTEFDLVHVGDDTMIGDFTSLQTHLFEDRVMKMSTVVVRTGASIGSRSVILYDSEVSVEAKLDPLSLVMKGENLPELTHWRGIPAERIS
jgi:non-ribosomal peptide synthetase-like protein